MKRGLVDECTCETFYVCIRDSDISGRWRVEPRSWCTPHGLIMLIVLSTKSDHVPNDDGLSDVDFYM